MVISAGGKLLTTLASIAAAVGLGAWMDSTDAATKTVQGTLLAAYAGVTIAGIMYCWGRHEESDASQVIRLALAGLWIGALGHDLWSHRRPAVAAPQD